MIRAECHTDDYAYEIRFDATLWFERAMDREILALASVDWGGDYPADQVGIDMSEVHDGLEEMFVYLHSPEVRARRDAPGFECHVNFTDAMAWLADNRPHLVTRIEAGDFGQRPDPRAWRPKGSRRE